MTACAGPQPSVLAACRSAPITAEQELALLRERIEGLVQAQEGDLPWRRDPLRRGIKRLFDLVGAASLMLPALPVMAVTALVVRLTSRGPVLLKQTRLGLNGAPYQMLKFRSMRAVHPDGSAGVAGEVTAADARLTPIGNFIRAWRIDELPQLLHVLAGTMSLVGPRPDVVENADLYSDQQLLRFAMPPGCTAWTFTRGAFRNDWATRQDINVEYVRQWSLWLDLRILVGSALVLLVQNEANPAATDAAGQVHRPHSWMLAY